MVTHRAMTPHANLIPGRELSGKVVLVTGAARHIGRAIARALAAGGADVMVNALYARDDLDATVRAIAATGRRAAAMVRMLCGPDARYVTGQAIHFNGGGHMP